MANEKDITLRIRAKDYSKQTFDTLTKTVGKLSTAMEEQRESAKKGTTSARELEASYQDLEKAAKAVIRQAADVKAFQNQATALDNARKAAIAAAQAQTQYEGKLAAQEKVTKAQQKELNDLTKTRERADKAVATQTANLQRSGARLAEYGVAVNNTDAALVKMANIVNSANTALKAQDSAIMNNEKHLRDLKAAQEAAASQEMAANLERQRVALSNLAAQQKAVANGWTSSAASVRSFGAAIKPLSAQINDMLNPGQAMNRTLTGIQETIAKLNGQLDKSRGPIKDFADKLNSLKSAQSGVVAMGQLVDSFRQQVVAVRAARTEYQQARQNVLALTQSLTQQGTNTKEVTAQLRAAQATLKGASENFNQLSVAARASQAALRAAGVDTRNMADAERLVLDTTKQLTDTTNRLTDAYNKNGAAGKRAAGGLGGFNDGGKTALSLFQRIRGEILSLTAAYGGIFGAINLANSAIDAAIVKQQTLAAVSVAVGKDQGKQAAEWDYVNKVADHFGGNLEAMAKAYGKFSAAAFGANMKGDQSKELFENITSIGTAYGKTADQMNLVFLAVEQMLSKGSIQAEEFKNQFGEQIPGAYEAGAKALGISLDDFKKKQQAGVLDATAVISIMRGLAKDSQDAADQMKNGIVATQNALDNAKFRFNLSLANSGFLDAYRELLEKVTALLSGPDGKELASALSTAFTSIATAAQFLVENLDLVQWALANLAFIKTAQLALSFGSSLKQVGAMVTVFSDFLTAGSMKLTLYAARLGTANIAVRALAVGMKVLSRAIPIIGWVLLALDIGKILYDQSATVRKIIDSIIEYLVASFKYVKGLLTGEYQSFDAILTDMRAKAGQATVLEAKVTTLVTDVNKATGKSGDGFKRTTTDTGYDDAAVNEKQFNLQLDKLKTKLSKDRISQDRRLNKDELSNRLDLIREGYAEQLKTAQKYGGETLKKTQALIEQAVENEKKAYAADHVKRGNGGANQRQNLITSTNNDLTQAESRSAKKQTFTDPQTSYAERQATAIKAANDQYAELQTRIQKIAVFDKAQADSMQKRLDLMKATTEEATRQQVAIAEIARLQDAMKNTQEERKNQESLINALYQGGRIDETEKVERLNKLYDESKVKILANIDALRQFAQVNQDTMTPEAFSALMTNLDTMQVKIETTTGAVEKFYTDLVGGLLNGVDTAFKSITDNLTAVYQGTMSWQDAMMALGTTMLQFFADLMRELALAILKTMILKALSSFSGSGGVMGSVGTAAAGSVGQNHNGGMAGGAGGHMRSISAGAFAGAPKFHSGGVVPGLRSDEVPAVLQKGEEVLTRDDPRHILNGGGSNNGGIRLIAVDDQRAAVAESLKTPQGQQAMIVNLRAQLPTVKAMLKS
jgi:tape measure domain-containing protein